MVEFECDLVGRHGVEYRGEVQRNSKLALSRVGKGIVVTLDPSEEMLGWLPREAAEVLVPMMREGRLLHIHGISLEHMVCNSKHKPPVRVVFNFLCQNQADEDKLAGLNGAQPRRKIPSP